MGMCSEVDVERSILDADTSKEAMRVQVAILRKLGPERRLRMALELSETVRAVAEAGIRHRHPDYDERQVRRALIRMMLGDELFCRYYGDQRQ